eukprot:TRINITY_DN15458_c0_g1_i2.p1 TRINITY_DN15458_c0_g1~~TRINITY_DN15458_c0_g1_i2.p1  ORF type:complete len:361 (+),score=79.14 TRINITY_DN15458_c0_g1_i2:52-1083(+)
MDPGRTADPQDAGPHRPLAGRTLFYMQDIHRERQKRARVRRLGPCLAAGCLVVARIALVQLREAEKRRRQRELVRDRRFAAIHSCGAAALAAAVVRAAEDPRSVRRRRVRWLERGGQLIVRPSGPLPAASCSYGGGTLLVSGAGTFSGEQQALSDFALDLRPRCSGCSGTCLGWAAPPLRLSGLPRPPWIVCCGLAAALPEGSDTCEDCLLRVSLRSGDESRLRIVVLQEEPAEVPLSPPAEAGECLGFTVSGCGVLQIWRRGEEVALPQTLLDAFRVAAVEGAKRWRLFVGTNCEKGAGWAIGAAPCGEGAARAARRATRPPHTCAPPPFSEVGSSGRTIIR